MSYWKSIWRDMRKINLKETTHMFSFYEDLLGDYNFRGKRVLEIGCGTGVNSILMGMRGAKITLMDYERSALNISKKLLEGLSVDAEFICGNAFDYDLNRGFDVVHSDGVVEHFLGEKRQRIIDIHTNALVPGGKCIVIVPNSCSVPFRAGKFFAEVTGTWIHGKEYPYTRNELVYRMEKSGLSVGKAIGGELMLSLVWVFAPLWLSRFNRLLRWGLSTKTRPGLYKINYNNFFADRWGRIVGACGKRV